MHQRLVPRRTTVVTVSRRPITVTSVHNYMTVHRLLLAGATSALIAGCSRAPDAPTATTQASSAHAAHGTVDRVNNGELTAEQKQAVAEVRNVTQRFHDIGFATAADGGGYTVQFPAGCAASSTPGEGAQGFHYLNEGLVDANVELL